MVDMSIMRWVYFLLAFLQAALTSGIIFGWVDLEKIFISERVYYDHCDPNDQQVPCKAQKLFFERLYTIGTFSNNFAPLFTGAFCDKFGPKITSLTSAGVFIAGCGLFMISNPTTYTVAFSLLGAAGPGVYVAIMHLNNLFPGNQAKILSFFSGTFTVSTFIFKIFRVMNEKDPWFSLHNLFMCYIFFILPFFLIGAFLWPNKPFSITPSSNEDEKKPLLPYENQKIQLKKVLFNASLKTQLLSPELWLIILWMAVSNLHITYFLGTVSDQDPGRYASTFMWIWNFGFIAIPFFGYLVDAFGVVAGILFCNVGLWLFSVISAISYDPIQYAAFVLVSFVNVGVWGIFYTFLSKTFGFANFGKLLGAACASIASVSLLQYPLLKATLDWFDGNYTYVNLLFVVLQTLVFFTPVFLYVRQRRLLMYAHKQNAHEHEGAAAHVQGAIISVN